MSLPATFRIVNLIKFLLMSASILEIHRVQHKGRCPNIFELLMMNKVSFPGMMTSKGGKRHAAVGIDALRELFLRR